MDVAYIYETRSLPSCHLTTRTHNRTSTIINIFVDELFAHSRHLHLNTPTNPRWRALRVLYGIAYSHANFRPCVRVSLWRWMNRMNGMDPHTAMTLLERRRSEASSPKIEKHRISHMQWPFCSRLCYNVFVYFRVLRFRMKILQTTHETWHPNDYHGPWPHNVINSKIQWKLLCNGLAFYIQHSNRNILLIHFFSQNQ